MSSRIPSEEEQKFTIRALQIVDSITFQDIRICIASAIKNLLKDADRFMKMKTACACTFRKSGSLAVKALLQKMTAMKGNKTEEGQKDSIQ